MVQYAQSILSLEMARTARKKNQNVELIVVVTQWHNNCTFARLTLMFARTRAARVPVRIIVLHD